MMVRRRAWLVECLHAFCLDVTHARFHNCKSVSLSLRLSECDCYNEMSASGLLHCTCSYTSLKRTFDTFQAVILML